MWTSLFDDIGFAKDFFRKPGERQFMRFAPADPLPAFVGYLRLINHGHRVISHRDRMAYTEQHFFVTN